MGARTMEKSQGREDARGLKMALGAYVVVFRDEAREYVGPGAVHAGLHVEVDPRLLVGEAERVAREVRQRVHEESDAGYCVIQVEAVEPEAASALEEAAGGRRAAVGS